MKERSSALARKTSAIRGTLFKTSEEGPLAIDSMQVTNDIESTFYQGCTICRTQIDLFLTEKDELIKTQNTLRKHINHLQSYIETLTANL